ncbi:MAG: response regulator [Pedobacter sp.]|nr:response regulator [Pedobacter sp.]
MDKIVIQETDRSVLDVIKIILTEAGFEVYATHHLSTDFLNIITKKHPDLVVLDYKLSGQEAIQVCNQIKKRFPQLPIIALSCNYNIDQHYRQLGFNDYIRKPFDIDTLVKIIRKHIPHLSAQS